MKIGFLELPPEERRLYIEQAALRRIPQTLGEAGIRLSHRPATFRFIPPAERQPALRRDYQAMRDMYLSEPATFDDILATNGIGNGRTSRRRLGRKRKILIIRQGKGNRGGVVPIGKRAISYEPVSAARILP